MKKSTIVLSGLLAVLLWSCGDKGGFKKTASGLSYKIISDGKAQQVKKGQVLKLHFSRKLNDSLMTTTYGTMPTYAQVDSVGPDYNPTEIFPMLRKGDSVVIVVEIDSLVKRQMQVPPFMKPKDKLILAMRVLDILPNGEAVQQDQASEMTKQKARDDQRKEGEIKEIREYLAKNKINAQELPSGVFYEIQRQGNGPKADTGKIVGINYTGYTLDGKFFDSNVDSSKQVEKHPLQPYEFMAGIQGAIPGMLEGITVFNEGGKGRLFIPSVLGYGSQGGGTVIKPYTNLIFDIEIATVRDAPAQQPQMQLPQQ